ncbi:MAG: serine/threonine protein kinase [Myxococcales bacterium]|nr:serine/threonine protein kinase [Myxococcales bacterium]
MVSPELTSALAALAPSLSNPAAIRGALDEPSLSPDARAAVAFLERAMPELTAPERRAELDALLDGDHGALLLAYCEASAARVDVDYADLLAAAEKRPALAEAKTRAARARIVEGPLLDALRCIPRLGDGRALSDPINAEARARIEILIWEAGASALEVPELGKWLWSSEATFDAMVGRPSHGALRGRVLAARCLEVAVRGMPPMTDPALVSRTLQVLQPLLLHPEPLVWIHAARALGRLAGTVEQLEYTLLDWVGGSTPVLRQRALTGFASLPADRLRRLAHELVALIESPEDEHWSLAAAAAATPYLFHGRREIWDKLAARILAGGGGANAARALARGLYTLFRRGHGREEVEPTLRRLREMARRAKTTELAEWRRWIEVIAVTDPIDAAERDPLDLELGLENLVRLAAQYDDEEADARAARFAEILAPTFDEARRVAIEGRTLRHRAAAMNALEGCARSLALRLWGPVLATRPHGDAIQEPDLEETWKIVARAPSELLDVVKERREKGESDPQVDEMLEVLAIRLGGYALDACGGEKDLGPGPGPAAHSTCVFLRKIQGLSDGSREMPPAIKNALAMVLWRLVDTTRGSALGEIDDVEWLGPFAAWWALVIDRPTVLQQLAVALPMIAEGALERCCALAEEIRAQVSSGALDGAWGGEAAHLLASLEASNTELAHALSGLADALEDFGDVSGQKPDLDARCLSLVHAAERLQAALADPVKALHRARPDDEPRNTENAARIASLVARAIQKRELTMLDVWFASLGPVTSALVEAAVSGAVRRTPPPPPLPKREAPKTIEGYELVKPLGEGGVGTVWLVRKPGADRLFVLKIPKADALAAASDTERAGILASFVEEAKALAGLYHPNVANIIDRGVSGNVPFLVLEYLMGADLKEYSSARLMSLFELRQVVLEACAGLTALHQAGLVHRDIKPANLWLRLPLTGGTRFDPEKHRDPARTPPLATVVIDFGMVRAMKVAPESAGRFVAGTPGYIAPEQVLDPVELDGRADVYSLAGTIYNVTTGRAFFDDITSPRDRIFAHMQRDPFEQVERLRDYPAALAKLMRAATAIDPKDRPTPMEFGREFVALL